MNTAKKIYESDEQGVVRVDVPVGRPGQRVEVLFVSNDVDEPSDAAQDIDAAWRDELARRVRSIKNGSAVLIDGDEVERELSEILDEG